jgi:hypothetical protein
MHSTIAIVCSFTTNSQTKEKVAKEKRREKEREENK